MYPTTLIQNQRCVIHSELALYPTTLISVFKGMFLPDDFSFEAISAVGYSADPDLALYPTTLIQN
jgi:hypothetical protein